jgi:hypothetical protein
LADRTNLFQSSLFAIRLYRSKTTRSSSTGYPVMRQGDERSFVSGLINENSIQLRESRRSAGLI